jgi:hypothetical protein
VRLRPWHELLETRGKIAQEAIYHGGFSPEEFATDPGNSNDSVNRINPRWISGLCA